MILLPIFLETGIKSSVLQAWVCEFHVTANVSTKSQYLPSDFRTCAISSVCPYRKKENLLEMAMWQYCTVLQQNGL